MGGPVRIELGTWEALRRRAEPVRRTVFVDEQRVPPEIEIDEFDPPSLHALAVDDDGAVLGTGRLLPDGHIGRMAVLKASRGRGVGAALLQALVDAARSRGDREVVLSAQTHAIPFYERFGFAAEGGEYDDAGIPHRRMRRRL
jgi:predicted GNAT family N-acyltransferase